MRNFGILAPATPRRPVPRGIASGGLPILSYGFRPFFLLAGLFAVLDMVLWIGALSGLWSVGGEAGPIAWHAHEMLFGYGTAALCGFVLTAVPNWTGRLPVSGLPLLGLVILWLWGRAALAAPAILGDTASAVVDALFLPALAFVIAREVVAGRNSQNLRVAGGIAVLALLNISFHLATLSGWDEMPTIRFTVALFTLMIAHIGGRIVPSFTRNYLAKNGATSFPRPMGRLDHAALAATLIAGIAWGVAPSGLTTATLAAVAAGLQAVRLVGWKGWATIDEPLLLVMHIAYAFVSIGYAAVALAALGYVEEPSALHLLTVGAIGMMTFAVMTRATRGHTGRPLSASWTTTTAYLCLFSVAVLRPLAEFLPSIYHELLDFSALAWIAAFSLFLIEHAPMLARTSPSVRRPPSGASRPAPLTRRAQDTAPKILSDDQGAA